MSVLATFYVVHGASDIYWRVQAPARAIGAKACVISETIGTRVLTEPNDDSPFPWVIGADGLPRYPAHEGATAVWTRPCSVRLVHALGMKAQGLKILAEVDDNHVSNPFLNVFMRANHWDGIARMKHMRTMASFDGIIFSTEILRDFYVKAIRAELGKKAVPQTFVCHNHIDEDDWPQPVPPREDGKLRIGYMGSMQHLHDVKLIYGALRWAADEGHEIVFAGIDPGDDTEVTVAKAKENCRLWRGLNYTHVPWVNPEQYHRTALPLDIGLAPLLRNEHTLGKSDIKWIEYLMSGAAPIVQAGTVYNECVHGETALLAASPMEFYVRLRQLVQDAALRRGLVEQGQAYIREHRSLRTRKHEWEEALCGVG